MNRKKMIRILLPAAAACIVPVLFAVFALPAMKYNPAKALLDAGKYEEAIAAFEPVIHCRAFSIFLFSYMLRSARLNTAATLSSSSNRAIPQAIRMPPERYASAL